ncbi:MAG: accessory factor UbiK family protein [Alphaproteobacteria bacterium]
MTETKKDFTFKDFPGFSRFAEDMVQLASGGLGVAASMQQTINEKFRTQLSSFLDSLDHFSREEIALLKEMLQQSRLEQEKLQQELLALSQRVAALEAGVLSTKPATKPVGKPVATNKSAKAVDPASQTAARKKATKKATKKPE